MSTEQDKFVAFMDKACTATAHRVFDGFQGTPDVVEDMDVEGLHASFSIDANTNVGHLKITGEDKSTLHQSLVMVAAATRASGGNCFFKREQKALIVAGGIFCLPVMVKLSDEDTVYIASKMDKKN